MIFCTSLPVSQRIKELVGEQIHTVYSWRRTVSFTLPEQEFVENPYRVVLGDHWNDDFYPNGKAYPAFPAVLLPELPEVLKKVGEKLGWKGAVIEHMYLSSGKRLSTFPDGMWHEVYREEWMYRYLKCCELHATTGEESVNNYLLELLK